MALYDNKHWILSHIRNSFISADDTGMCEIVMTGENICKKLSDVHVYPGIEENDEDDDLAHSLDNHSDLEFGLRRQRSNTAVRLEKMNKERKEAAIARIKWPVGKPFSSLTEEEKDEMFSVKQLPTNVQNRDRKISLLSMQLQKCPFFPQNPFQQYSRFDGNAQIGVPTRKYGIFLTMLQIERRNYPLSVTVIAIAKVRDLIGLILFKCSLEYPDFSFKDNVSSYGLHIAEDDGEVDWVFPSLDPKEIISKFVFRMLALVEKKDIDNSGRQNSMKHDVDVTFNEISFDDRGRDEIDGDEVNSLQNQVTAMEASLYTYYKVLMLNKVRAKTEVHLGISGEKIDIDPVLKQNTGTKFLSKRKPISYSIDKIVACDLTETKSNNKAIFRLVHDGMDITDTGSSTEISFKHHDFECDQKTALGVVQKLNHILELRCSSRRKEYLTVREKKSHKKKSFHFGPR